MRINSITITGFGPYRETQAVDFDAFAGDGLFLITGRTGAGKSSILDAICFALYGAIPRYGAESNSEKLRSDYCSSDEVTEVELQFTVGATKYRVTRRPEYMRPALRGDKLTKSAAFAELAVLGSDWQVTHAGPRDVGQELDQIVKLNREEFQQVILLAQNRFHEFLTAKDDQRQAVLRTLFNTERFGSYEESLNARRNTTQKAKENLEREHHLALQDAADLAGPDTLPTLATVVTAAHTLEALADDLATAADAAKAAYALALKHQSETALLLEKQRRVVAARESLDQLTANQPVITAKRVVLASAERADKVLPFLDEATASKAELDEANSAEHAVRLEAPELGDDVRELEQRIDALAKETGALGDALVIEELMPNHLQRLTDARDDFETVDAKAKESEARKAEIPDERKELSDRFTSANQTAARLTDIEKTLGSYESESAASSRVAAVEEEVTTALEEQLAAGAARTAASTNLDRLRAQHLNGYAAQLATKLVDGEPCEVCGSLTHPMPATPTQKLVTELEIEQAELEFKAADSEDQKVSKRVNSAKEILAAERARMNGKTAEKIQADLEDTRTQLELAKAAQKTARQLKKEIEALDAETEELEKTLTTLTKERDGARAEIAAAETTLSAAQATLTSHRGGFESVAAHKDALQSEMQSTQAVVDAIRIKIQKKTLFDKADKRFLQKLTTNGFKDKQNLADSALPLDEQELIREQIRDAEVELARVTLELKQPELIGLPKKPADTQKADARVKARETERDTTRDESTATRIRAEHLRQALPSLKSQADQLQTLADDYETIQTLAASVRGDLPNTKQMKLEAFVLAAELEEIVEAANVRLSEMSDGRYELAHSDALRARRAQSGLGLQILDSHTGRPRTTQSLSGGETFLASLALALGLAEVVTNRAGGIQLETLFIDEGFGSLDSDTLEIAMGTLDSLRSNGRTVGLISHVETMKEQIPAKLSIDVADGGWSVISQPPAA